MCTKCPALLLIWACPVALWDLPCGGSIAALVLCQGIEPAPCHPDLMQRLQQAVHLSPSAANVPSSEPAYMACNHLFVTLFRKRRSSMSGTTAYHVCADLTVP